MINECAVKEFVLKTTVVGHPLVYLGDTGVIIGVAKDAQYKSMHEKIGRMMLKNQNPQAVQRKSRLEKFWMDMF